MNYIIYKIFLINVTWKIIFTFCVNFIEYEQMNEFIELKQRKCFYICWKSNYLLHFPILFEELNIWATDLEGKWHMNMNCFWINLKLLAIQYTSWALQL